MSEIDVMIAGTVLLDPAQLLDGAVAEVRLRASGLADAPSRTIASTRVPCSGASVREIPFELSARIERDGDYSLAAEVRREGGERLRPGDLLTTEHHGWRVDDGGDVTLTVKPVS